MRNCLERFNNLSLPMKVLSVPGLLAIACVLLCVSPLILFVLAITAAKRVLVGDEEGGF